MEQITAAGGVLYRKADTGIEVLLIFRNGVWDLPKGKREEGESVEECAVREVAEELGIPEPEITSYLCETRHRYKQGGKEFAKTTFWYAMAEKIPSEMSPQTEEGITGLKWVPISEAVELVGYENLKNVLLQFTDRFENH